MLNVKIKLLSKAKRGRTERALSSGEKEENKSLFIIMSNIYTNHETNRREDGQEAKVNITIYISINLVPSEDPIVGGKQMKN